MRRQSRHETKIARIGGGNMKEHLKVPAIAFCILLFQVNTTFGQGRTVAVHSGRPVAGSDIVLMTPREFVIPQEVGTIWNYQFYDANGGLVKNMRWGLHVWTITSRSIAGNDTTLHIRDIEFDSLQLAPSPFPATYQVDTVYFTIVISADSIMLSFPEPKADPFNPVVPAVARYSLQGSDTLSMQIGDGLRGAIVDYVKHVGMIQYAFHYSTGITTAVTEMNLVNYMPIVSSVLEPRTPTPTIFALAQNYPNPFNPTTTIRYTLPQRSHVKLSVFNTLGQQVATFVNEYQSEGYHDVAIDGALLSSGVYFYRIDAGEYTATKKMLLLK